MFLTELGAPLCHQAVNPFYKHFPSFILGMPQQRKRRLPSVEDAGEDNVPSEPVPPLRGHSPAQIAVVSFLYLNMLLGLALFLFTFRSLNSEDDELEDEFPESSSSDEDGEAPRLDRYWKKSHRAHVERAASSAMSAYMADDDETFWKNFRMTKSDFRHLDRVCQYPRTMRQTVSTTELLGATIFWLAQGISIDHAARDFGFAQSQLKTHYPGILAALIAGLREDPDGYIGYPSTEEGFRDLSVRMTRGNQQYRYLDGCIGCGDGSLIAWIPAYLRGELPLCGEELSSFRCRKNFISQNIMCICDADRRILALHVGAPGSINQ
jgi:hypothetical protein